MYGDDATYISLNYGVSRTTIWILADLNADGRVDEIDLEVIAENGNMTGATRADGDLDGDGEVTMDDLDLALAQYGLGIDAVS